MLAQVLTGITELPNMVPINILITVGRLLA